jgi:streptogramin lyase
MELFHHRREVPRSRFSQGTREMRKARRRRPALGALESRKRLTWVFDHFPLSVHSTPEAITTGPNGQIWFSQTAAGEVGMLNPATGQMGTPVAVGTNSSSMPVELVSAAGMIWVAENGSNAIGEIQLSNGGRV